MNLNEFLEAIKSHPEITNFTDVINTIDTYYDYEPSNFFNGPESDGVFNKAGENEGSCKIFSFAKLNDLNVEQTLNCFGQYYRLDVLQHPNNTDHANIRTFIKYGWDHIKFEKAVLKLNDS